MHYPIRTVILAMLALVAGCTSWEEVRDETVHPVNQLLHKRYAKVMKTGDLSIVESLYEQPARSAALAEERALFARFGKVEQGEYVIERLLEVEDQLGDVVADCFVAVRGTDRSGRKLCVEERRRVHCVRDEGGAWLIRRSERLAREQHAEATPTFTEVAESRGMRFANTCRETEDRFGERWPYASGSGMGVGDVDGDGTDDVLMVATGTLRLFLDRGSKFVDATEASGLAAPASGLCRFALMADWDNDGDQDLFVGVTGGEDLMFRNDRGRFVAVEHDATGLASTGNSTSACAADFDGDGLLDLYVVGGGDLLTQTPSPIWKAKNATANRMFRNRGDWTFTEVTEKAGVGDSGWGLATTTADYDRDGDVDLFVANDFGRNVLYRNRGDGTFEDVSDAAGITHHGAHMGCAFGDVDNDGDLDLFVAGMASNSRWIMDLPAFPAPASFPWNVVIRSIVMDIINQMMHGNRLYLNRGDGTFEEVSTRAGVRDSDWAWGGLFLDYDNDGRLDLYVVNGFVSNPDPFDC